MCLLEQFLRRESVRVEPLVITVESPRSTSGAERGPARRSCKSLRRQLQLYSSVNRAQSIGQRCNDSRAIEVSTTC